MSGSEEKQAALNGPAPGEMTPLKPLGEKGENGEGPVDTGTSTDVPQRESWAGKADFLLSCIGYSIGLGQCVEISVPMLQKRRR